MSLVDDVAERLGDPDRAITALGIVFMVIRLSLKPEQYQTVQEAIPDADSWVKRAIAGSMARTGEMLAIQSAESIRGRLLAAGLNEAQIGQLGEAVHDALADCLGTQTLEDLVTTVPLLSTANR